MIINNYILIIYIFYISLANITAQAQYASQYMYLLAPISNPSIEFAIPPPDSNGYSLESLNDQDREHISHILIRLDLIRGNVQNVFEELRTNSEFNFLSSADIAEISQFKDTIIDLLSEIQTKVLNGKMRPWIDFDISDSSSSTSPLTGAAGEKVHLAIFPGTFDPFHMGHLVAMLKHLADPNNTSDFVVTIPNSDREVKANPSDPYKNPFSWRYRLMMEVLKDFHPIIRLSDIGKSYRTREYFIRLLNKNIHHKIEITHVMGSDVLHRITGKPIQETLTSMKVLHDKIKYQIQVYQRKDEELSEEEIDTFMRENKVKVIVGHDNHADRFSSTSFRKKGELNIFYPTTLKNFAVFFMYKNWGWPEHVKHFIKSIEGLKLLMNDSLFGLFSAIAQSYSPDSAQEQNDLFRFILSVLQNKQTRMNTFKLLRLLATLPEDEVERLAGNTLSTHTREAHVLSSRAKGISA